MATAAARADKTTKEAHVPPQNLDAEEAVLGAMMLSEAAIAVVSEALSREGREFYRESHARIYRAALALFERSEPVDAITLADELDERGDLESAGGKVRVQELAATVPTTANVGHYARIVRDTATLRQLISAGDEIARLGWDRPGETDHLVAEAEDILVRLSETRSPGELVLLKDALHPAFERITRLYENREEVTGLATHFRDLDRLTGGLQPGNLVILAARPSMGKSALGLAMAANVAVRDKKPCIFFGLEMSSQEIVQRLLCSEAKVNVHSVRTGHLSGEDWPRLANACSRLENAPLFIDDTAALTMLELRSRAQVIRRRHPELGLLVVDYLQLMSTGQREESRLQEVSAISRGLKALARDLDIPVLALSQLSRAVEQRTDKRPMLADLRESGTIEQDADLVMFLYRDDYYDQDSEDPGIAELKLAKHRNGPTDTVRLAFIRNYAKFSDVAA